MKFAEKKRMLDRSATYFWENRNGRYALVNSLTLKTAFGVPSRWDAIKTTETLAQYGYSIAKLATEGAFS